MIDDRAVIDAAVLREIRFLQENVDALAHGVMLGQIHWRYPKDIPYGDDLRRSLARLRRRREIHGVRRGFDPLKYIAVAAKVEA